MATIPLSGRPVAQLGPARTRQWVPSVQLAELWGTPIDLAIAATANVHGVALLTYNTAGFQIIEDLVAVRAPR